jgi:hypothetical protein
MTPARRLFVLLGACEDLTDRETGALRRGDIDHAVTLETRKTRLTEAMAAARQNAELSPDDASAFIERVRCLEARENRNLSFLREEMERARTALAQINQATRRSRMVRRGYAGTSIRTAPSLAEPVLGRA